MRQRLEGIAIAFLWAEDMIVRLWLPAMSGFGEEFVGMAAQETHEASLVSVPAPAVEQEVNVVRHQAMNRAGHIVAPAAMEHQPAEARGETGIQPARASVSHREGPMDDGLALVGALSQTRQMPGEVFFVGFRSIRHVLVNVAIPLVLANEPTAAACRRIRQNAG